jgi:hypothetical protein
MFLMKDLGNGRIRGGANAVPIHFGVHAENIFNVAPCNLRCNFHATDLRYSTSKHATHVAISRFVTTMTFTLAFNFM